MFLHRFVCNNQESVLLAQHSNSINLHHVSSYLLVPYIAVESTCQQYLCVSCVLAGPCQGSHAKAQALISSGPRLLREFSSTFVAHKLQNQNEHSVQGSNESEHVGKKTTLPHRWSLSSHNRLLILDYFL